MHETSCGGLDLQRTRVDAVPPRHSRSTLDRGSNDFLEHGRGQNLLAKVQRFLVQLSVDSRATPVRGDIREMVGPAIRRGS